MTQVALSTMWGIGRFDDIRDFVAKAYETGFSHVELNYQLTPDLLRSILQVSDLRVSSVHSPCPSPLLDNDIWAYRLSLSSLDEAERRQAVRFACSTVALAKRLGLKWVILHLGSVAPLLEVERPLRQLYRDGKRGGERFEEMRYRLASMRKDLAPPYLDIAVKSLKELLDYAQKVGVGLALETRAYIFEIPSLQEMVWLLDEMNGERLSCWYDVGHVETQKRLGFDTPKEWLDAVGDRIVGVHLHDVQGLTDHRPPGTGEVDWDLVSHYLPAEAIRVFELGNDSDDEGVKNALLYLKEKGILL